MAKPKSPATPTETPIILELPGASRYRMGPRAGKVRKYLEADHVPRLGPGVAAIRVQVTRGDTGYVVSLAPDELERLLQHAHPALDLPAKGPPRPAAEIDPTRGQGRRDPEAHRLGPNVDHSPDHGHRGKNPLRRKP